MKGFTFAKCMKIAAVALPILGAVETEAGGCASKTKIQDKNPNLRQETRQARLQTNNGENEYNFPQQNQALPDQDPEEGVTNFWLLVGNTGNPVRAILPNEGVTYLKKGVLHKDAWDEATPLKGVTYELGEAVAMVETLKDKSPVDSPVEGIYKDLDGLPYHLQMTLIGGDKDSMTKQKVLKLFKKCTQKATATGPEDRKFRHLSIYFTGLSVDGDWGIRDHEVVALKDVIGAVYNGSKQGPSRIKLTIYCDTSYAGKWVELLKTQTFIKDEYREGIEQVTIITATDADQEAYGPGPADPENMYMPFVKYVRKIMTEGLENGVLDTQRLFADGTVIGNENYQQTLRMATWQRSAE